MMFWAANATAGVEIKFGGLSPAAQKAIENMGHERQKAKANVTAMMEKLDNLKETYRSTCDNGEPTHEECPVLFNRIIDGHKDIVQTISELNDDYKRSLKIVVEELQPQLESIAYAYTPSDIMDDLEEKWDPPDFNFYHDPFLNAIHVFCF